MKNAFKYKIKYEGLNFSNFLNFAIKHELKIENINKIDNKNIEFLISAKDYKKLKKINSGYSLKIINNGGFKKLWELLLKRIGLVVGGVAVVVFMTIFSKTTMYINVLGGKTYEQQIKNCIANYGIKLGKINNFESEDLEKYLLNNIPQLSLVSVQIKGNTIIVNAYENEEESINYLPFVAEYNMVIKEITLISGTLNVDVNSVVKKGSVLVEPYTIGANGERVSCEANAIIKADVWFCGSETVLKQEEVFEKTGNKKSYSKLSFIKNINTNFVSPYNNFVTETYNKCLTNNNFLPIYLTKTTFYETKKLIKNFDFEKEKNKFIEKSKQKAYANLPKFVTINEENINITERDDKYIFQVYLKAEMEFKK